MAPFIGPRLEQPGAFARDGGNVDRFFGQLLAARLDAGQIEDVVDQGEQIVPGAVDVGRVMLVRADRMRPHHLVAEDFRKPHDRR